MQEGSNSVFVIADSQPVSPITFYAKGLLREHSFCVDSVHVREQQNPFDAFSPKACDDSVCDAFRSILKAQVTACRRHLFYLASQGAEPLGDPITTASDTIEIARSGLNRNQYSQGVQKRLLLPLNRHPHRSGILCPCGGNNKQCDEHGAQLHG